MPTQTPALHRLTAHRRTVVICLHWSAVMLILTMVKGGISAPWVLSIFVAVIALWSAITVTCGLLGRPGPKLSAPMRRAYPWIHRLLHLLLGLTAGAIALRLIGHPLAWLDAWILLLVTLCAGTFHAMFHFWRHTALYDGALRLITPRFMHKWL
ncbi:hypothetical protein [Sulfitobacter aestuariivivens]|uniref:Uncharacterized protein n=1 Tax=Sulfitobacter aestuariivivens TaxID=2766981 RepID=A0A927D1I5_9RHOB|nr:hypothetical protein [Sulfitobacter aestuariivivens]MBD3662638.1 hypothetical protein [Sulfitobacter aestuariivivens]